METKQVLALPSTSQESFQACSGEHKNEKDNIVAMRCLDVVQKIASKLKSDTNGFFDVLQKVLSVIESTDENRNSKYDVIETVMVNIMDADKEELISIKDDFKKIFCTKEVRKLWIDNDAIIRIAPLDEGAFGIVTRGVLKGPGGTSTEVAIKSAKDPRFKEVIEKEASVMVQLNHKNIMKILAINKSNPEIVMELMDLGNLASAVEHVNFTAMNLLKLLNDVANGMEYLHGKKYIHRDLACRNVFLNSKKKCKIGDFGHCVYVGDSDGVYLEKVHDGHPSCAAPETIWSKEYTMENDFWGMGILCWELFYIMENANKYPPSVYTKKKHIELLLSGQKRLVKPDLCPMNVYEYIGQILNRNPKGRPNFTVIKRKLKEFISGS